MTVLGETDFGPLAPLVALVGSIMAAAGAIGLAWKGRARWEPSEEDVAAGPQRVGGLLAAVAIVALWIQARDEASNGFLGWLAIALAVLCLVSLLLYSVVIQTQTYEVVYVPPGGGAPATRKVIGGFSLTEKAKRVAREKGITTQEILSGSEYDVDKVWPRGSRALAKLVFIACYLALTVSGTIAIASAALWLGNAAD